MLKVEWIDHGRKAKNPPDPAFPEGKDMDVSDGATATCAVELPYPAPQCGLWRVGCDRCGLSVGITAAGRPDDPRSVKIACKLGATGEFPDGKSAPDDEGGLAMSVGHDAHGNVRIDFGKPVAWLALPPDEAVALGQALIAHARDDSASPRAPGYWMHESTGALRGVIETYLSGMDMTPDQIAGMRAYLRQWINAPVWGGPGVQDLRDGVDNLTSRAAIMAWLDRALAEDIDPL